MHRSPLIAAAVACAAPAFAAPDAPAPILMTAEAKDVLTYAQPEVARVTHVDLDLTADLSAHVMRGTAALEILTRPGARQIILDDNSSQAERSQIIRPRTAFFSRRC